MDKVVYERCFHEVLAICRVLNLPEGGEFPLKYVIKLIDENNRLKKDTGNHGVTNMNHKNFTEDTFAKLPTSFLTEVLRAKPFDLYHGLLLNSGHIVCIGNVNYADGDWLEVVLLSPEQVSVKLKKAITASFLKEEFNVRISSVAGIIKLPVEVEIMDGLMNNTED